MVAVAVADKEETVEKEIRSWHRDQGWRPADLGRYVRLVWGWGKSSPWNWSVRREGRYQGCCAALAGEGPRST